MKTHIEVELSDSDFAKNPLKFNKLIVPIATSMVQKQYKPDFDAFEYILITPPFNIWNISSVEYERLKKEFCE